MHNRNSLLFMQACLQAGDMDLAKKVSAAVKKDLQQQVQFYESLKGDKAEAMAQEIYMTEELLSQMNQLEKAETNDRIVIPGKVMRRADTPTK
jgi:hypothetical protein